MKPTTRKHTLLCILASIPVYWAALYYIELATHEEIEELAVAVTIGFFGFMYSGRYIAQIWGGQSKVIASSHLLGLGALIALCVIWLFVHADYPLTSAPALNLFFYWMPFVVMSVALGAFIKLIRINQSRLTAAQAHEAHSHSELRLLQSQLSPHFLFNTLNNLYGISISRHQEMPGLLLKLSELLRYSVYEAKEPFVLLKDELAYINNYMAFEKIRIGNRLQLHAEFAESDENTRIAPMLLIIFIENAFKHAKDTTEQQIFIDIRLKTWSNFIQFEIKNSHQAHDGERVEEKHSGFGLDNVKKRLHLLYPGRHNLTITDKDGFYTVMLQLEKVTA